MTHVPVLLKETVTGLAVKAGGTYVDGTLGRAGHAAAILEQAGEDATYVGIDRDETALAESRTALAMKGLGKGVTFVHGRHGDIAVLAAAAGVKEADGVLLDLGVSSPQLDEAARGFSFMKEGPLDMRMDTGTGETAADLVNGRDEEFLANIFRDYGEEPQARRIAKAIVRRRDAKPFMTTLQLADFVVETIGRHGAHHPATRIFQALRMAVNDESGELARALEGGLGLLKTGGRFAVITFESLTDRIVKRFFAAHAGREVSLQAGGSRWEGVRPRVRLVTRHAIVAQAEEVNANARSRSAKLRVAERI